MRMTEEIFLVRFEEYLNHMKEWFNKAGMVASIQVGMCPFLCDNCSNAGKQPVYCVSVCGKFKKSEGTKTCPFSLVPELPRDPRYSPHWRACSNFYGRIMNSDTQLDSYGESVLSSKTKIFTNKMVAMVRKTKWKNS